jgi:hypothetical protein
VKTIGWALPPWARRASASSVSLNTSPPTMDVHRRVDQPDAGW